MDWFLHIGRAWVILLSCLLSVCVAWSAPTESTEPCSSSRSRTTRISVRPNGTIKLERPAKTVLCPGTDAIVLRAPQFPATYIWYWNGSAINGLDTYTQVVSQPGSYYARVFNWQTNDISVTDTITLTAAPTPTATLKSDSPNGILCERDSLLLTAGGGLSYRWFLNSNELTGVKGSTYMAKQAGRYSVTLTDANGCQASSGPLTITVQPRQQPVIDSIPPVCGPNALPVSLRASPAGGTFSGSGVAGAIFNPTTAGLGVHTISYQAPPFEGCPGDNGQRIIQVVMPPAVELPEQIVTSSQGIFSLEPTVTGNGPFTYHWQPAIWLNHTNQAEVTVTFPKNDTTYTVQVQDVFGCTTDASVRIIIKSQASIPDAFTPNGDQVNDTWKLPGIESYPNAQITIFSRWGEAVYHSAKGYLSPFDGNYNGEPLPAGMYLYTIKLSPESPPLRGAVFLAR